MKIYMHVSPYHYLLAIRTNLTPGVRLVQGPIHMRRGLRALRPGPIFARIRKPGSTSSRRAISHRRRGGKRTPRMGRGGAGLGVPRRVGLSGALPHARPAGEAARNVWRTRGDERHAPASCLRPSASQGAAEADGKLNCYECDRALIERRTQGHYMRARKD